MKNYIRSDGEDGWIAVISGVLNDTDLVDTCDVLRGTHALTRLCAVDLELAEL